MLKIKMPYGTLFAEISCDSDYPGINIYLRSHDGKTDTLLTSVEYSMATEQLRTLFYQDALDDGREPEILVHQLGAEFEKLEDLKQKDLMEASSLSTKGLMFNHYACFTTIAELEIAITYHLRKVTGKPIEVAISTSDEEQDSVFYLMLTEEGEDDGLSDHTYEFIAEKYINPQEEIELFRMVLEDMYGPSSFAEYVYDDNINIFVPMKH